MLMKPSKYLPFFQENKERLTNDLELIGDVLLIERMTFPEKKVGSIFIADSKKIQVGGFTTEIPEFYRVLLVGRGYYDAETGTDSPIDVEQGDIIHTGAASVKLWSSFPLLETADADILGLTRHGDILARWKSEETFYRFLTDFNQSVKGQVEKAKQ